MYSDVFQNYLATLRDFLRFDSPRKPSRFLNSEKSHTYTTVSLLDVTMISFTSSTIHKKVDGVYLYRYTFSRILEDVSHFSINGNLKKSIAGSAFLTSAGSQW